MNSATRSPCAATLAAPTSQSARGTSVNSGTPARASSNSPSKARVANCSADQPRSAQYPATALQSRSSTVPP